jgi:hypothetical protein
LHDGCPQIKSFTGVQGAVFQKSPLVAEGKKNENIINIGRYFNCFAGRIFCTGAGT